MKYMPRNWLAHALACSLLMVSNFSSVCLAQESQNAQSTPGLVSSTADANGATNSASLDKDGYVIQKAASQVATPGSVSPVSEPVSAASTTPASSSPIQTSEPTKAASDVAEAEPHNATTVEKCNVSLRRSSQDATLAIKYADNYPFPLVGIQFPVDYEPGFSSDVGSLPAFAKYKPDTVMHFVNEQVVRSSYLACALYERLADLLPDKCIELIPTKLGYDKTSNRVVAIPSTKPVPPVVLVDLFSDFNLNRLQNPAQIKSSDTFGDRTRTFVSMSMPIAGERRPFAGQPDLVALVNKETSAVEAFYNNICNGHKSKSGNKLGDLQVTSKSVYSSGSFASVPLDFRSDYNDLLTDPSRKQVAYYANLIVDALNTQSLDEAKKALLAEYVDDVDGQLAEFLRSNGAKPVPAMAKSKVNFCNHCLLYERTQLYTRDAYDLAKTLWSDDFAKLYRSSVKSEADYMRQLAASQRRAAIGSFLSVASMAGSVAGAFVPTSVPVSSICTVFAFSAARAVAMECKLQQQLHQDYLRNSTTARTCEVSCVVMLDNDKIVVDGNSMEAHRANVIKTYQKQFATTASSGTAI